MKKQVILIYFLFFALATLGQNEAAIWYFGNHAGLRFNGGTPTPLYDSAMNAVAGSAVMSDVSGHLLFYTNGQTVWDRTHTIMPTASLGGGNQVTQPVVILPKPGDSSKFFVFTVGRFSYNPTDNHGLMSVIIDMNLRGGLGDEDVSTLTYHVPVTCEKITTVKHANGIDDWVIVHEWGNNKFYVYLVSASGISAPIISQLGVYYNGTPWLASRGYLKANPQGTKLMCANWELPSQLLDFNPATGVISNDVLFYTPVNNTDGYYGVEFSASGRYLYMTNIYNKTICQFDMMAPDIEASKTVIYTGTYPLYALQMAPDGKIYVAQASVFSEENKKYLGVINNPEGAGTNCNFISNALYLGDGFHESVVGLPNYSQSYFNQTRIVVQQFCLGNTTSFSVNSTQPIISVIWNFGDGNTSNALSPNHNYTAPGSYNVSATITTAAETVIKNQNVIISSSPVANTITNVTVCGNAADLYDLTQNNTPILGSQSVTEFDIAYFNSQSDADNHTNALSNTVALPIGSYVFYAKIFNRQNRSCYATTSFSVSLNQQPIANQPTDYIICESIPYDNIEQFDLSTKIGQILNGQSPIDFTVSFHSSQSDADSDVSALPLSYANALPTETIFARIENNNNSNCFTTTSFVVKVIQQPSISTVSDFKVCDDISNNGLATFDLTQKTLEILNGQSASVFEVKYFQTQPDAQNNLNEITAPIVNISNSQTIYYSIGAIGNSNCKSISSFNLAVNQLPVANNVNPVFVCDDNSNDGKEYFNMQNNNSTVLGVQNPGQFTVSYHISALDASTDSNPIIGNYQNTTNPQIIHVRIENNQNPSCYVTNSFQIGVYKMPIANQPGKMVVCDDGSNDGFETFTLASQTVAVLGSQSPTDFNVSYHELYSDALTGNNTLQSNYTNTSNPKTIYVRVENKTSPTCFATVSFQLIVRQKPELNMTDVYSICEGTSITVSAPSGFSTYTWSNGVTTPSTVITQSGNYSVTVTQNYGDVICDVTKNFVVHNSNIATITNIETEDWTTNQNTITVFVTGDGIYEYSIDGVNYQDSNQFYNLTSGEFTVYVRDKKGCGIATDEVYLLMYPNFFTPNGDGYNDYWNIKFANNEPNLKVSIFDRYGKLITVFNGDSIGWNGLLNGQQLSSSDYWFVVQRTNGKEYKGHFSLKR